MLEENDRFVVARGLRLETDEKGRRRTAGDILVRILKDAGSRPGVLERYTRELQVTSLLAHHPLVIRYHDVDMIGNRYCVITDHLPYPSLEALLLGRQLLPYPAALAVLRGLVSLLSAANEHHMAERQIRLEDLLVDPATGDVKLVKFSTPRSMTVRGTMTVRQGAAALVGDMYFLGCTMFRLLALDHAHSGQDSSEMLAAERLAAALKQHPDELSAAEVESIGQLFARLTTRDLAGHYETLGEVSDELDRLESLNEKIAKARKRADTFSRRARKAKLLETAWDTVAAFRGEVQAPKDEPKTVEELDPGLRGAATLLWDRMGTDSRMPMEDPMVVRGMMVGALGLFLLMLFWLLFTH